MTWQKLPKPSTLWEEGEKWFELEDNLTEGKFDFLEYKEEPLPKGIILQRDVSVAMGPETLGTPGDLSRIWVAFTDQETGEIYLARSDADWNQWEEYLHIIYAPSGSYQPSLTFGQDGWHRMTVTLVPAGEEIPEVWIIQPPYSGDGIRRLDLGEYPRIFQDYWGNTWVFYYKSDVGFIYSKSSKDNFASATEINLSNQGYPPLGVRIPYWEVTPYHDQFRNVLFFGSGKNMPFYVSSQIEDIYTVGLDLYITKWDGSPLEGAIVEVEGQSGITNKEGLVTFFKLPFDANVEIKLFHPSMGMGDTQHIFIPESAKGTHITHALFFTNPKIKENLCVQTGITGIEWIGTEFVEVPIQEKLGLGVDLGIEWESMLIPTYVLVYSGMEVVDSHKTDEIFDTSLLTGSTYSETYNVVEFLLDSILNSIYIKTSAAGTYRVRIQNEGGTVTHHDVSLPNCPAQSMVEFELPEQLSITAGSRYRVLVNRPSSTVYAEGNGYEGNLWRNITGAFGGTVFAGWVNAMGFGFISEEYGYKVVPGATVQLGGQTSQTNQEGLAPFQDLQGGSLQDYEIMHPDYLGVSTGTILIPEGEFDFIPLKIYEKPWDGYALEEMKVHADLGAEWVAIDIEYRQPKESISVSAGLTSILWVEVTE